MRSPRRNIDFRFSAGRCHITGIVEPKRDGGGAVAKLGSAQLSIVKALVEAQPDARLEELCKRLAKKTAIKVSVSTMQRAIQNLELSVKKNINCL